MSWDDAVDGVDRETPGGRMPRAWDVARRHRLPAANDDAPDHDDLPAYAAYLAGGMQDRTYADHEVQESVREALTKLPAIPS